MTSLDGRHRSGVRVEKVRAQVRLCVRLSTLLLIPTYLILILDIVYAFSIELLFNLIQLLLLLPLFSTDVGSELRSEFIKLFDFTSELSADD